jgi:hypothetical protein
MIMNEDRDNIRELLSAYIDGEVTDEQSASIKQAVATDPELAIELHELKAAKRLLLGLPKERAPRGFVRKVMVRAERKHLLGDHHAGGRFAAARWITLAVAATVLLAAGIGIIAVNRLYTEHHTPTIAGIGDNDGRDAGGPNVAFDNGSGVKKGAGSVPVGGTIGKSGVGEGTNLGLNSGGKVVVADEAFDYAVANAKNASIYTHNVSDTLTVLNETLLRNDIQPLELAAPARSSKSAGKAPEAADKKADVSRGALNFYYNKKQDAEQVQIVVLATDEVIEKLNGDLTQLAIVQKVSQAPSLDYAGRSDGTIMARRRAGPSKRRPEDSAVDSVGDVMTARGGPGVFDSTGSTNAGSRAKSKMMTKDIDDAPAVGKGAPAPAVVAPVAAPTVGGVAKAPKLRDNTQIGAGEIVTVPAGAAPPDVSGGASSAPKQPKTTVSKTANSGQDIVEGENSSDLDTVAGSDGWVGQVAAKVVEPQSTPRPAPAKPSVTGPTPKPSGTVLAASEQQKKYEARAGVAELNTLSSQIAKEQKEGKSVRRLDYQYGKLNKAFRQQIFDDDIRRNVQSQREQGVNIQALVININRRSLMNLKLPATRNAARRATQALSRPEKSAELTPAVESTTQKSAAQAETGR